MKKEHDFIKEESKVHSVNNLCLALGISTSGYYRAKENVMSLRSKEDEHIKCKLLEIHENSRYRYGYRPMHEHLKELGVYCGRDRTRRLMKELSIQPRKKKCYKPEVTNSNHSYGYRENLLREMDDSHLKKDSVWVSDTTYIRQGNGWGYLAVVMDLHTRRVVGWSVSDHNDSSLVIKALKNVSTRTKN